MSTFDLPVDQRSLEAHLRPVDRDPSDGGHRRFGSQCCSASVTPLPVDHPWLDTQPARVDRDPSPLPPDHHRVDTQGAHVGWEEANAELVIYAKTLDELMQPRIACGNRLYQLRQFGLEETKGFARMEGLQEGIHDLEKESIKALEDAMKRHPLGPWVMQQKGVGLKTAARLLAIIGNPADRPNPAKLWAYCGYHVVNGAAPKRAKGEQANWNTSAKTLCYLVAEACVKNRTSAYRHVYDDARAKYADAAHTTECAQCGICDGCGKPPGKNKQTHLEDTGCDDRRIRRAQPGDPLKDGHKHARAMRLVAKAFLLDLWKEARRLDSTS